MKLMMNLLRLKKNYAAAAEHSSRGGRNVENLHYNWIVTRQLAVRPPCTGSLAHTKVKLSASEDFVYNFYFVEDYGVLTHGHHCNSRADIFEIRRIRMASSQAWNLCGVNERERR